MQSIYTFAYNPVGLAVRANLTQFVVSHLYLSAWKYFLQR